MFLSSAVSAAIAGVLCQHTGIHAEVLVRSAVSGGSINNCCRIEFAGERYFVKVNSASGYPGMFGIEAESLKITAGMGGIKVPAVIGEGTAGEEQFLILEWIDAITPGKLNFIDLGRKLAFLHKNSSDRFGFSFSNYIGSLRQSNDYHDTAAGFFCYERLVPMIKMANHTRLLDSNLLNRTNLLMDKLPGLIPEEPPAFIHGDLWSGNFMISGKGGPVLIDPAVSYSHREADIAMTVWFGGFDSSFYEAYHEVYLLVPGWKERTELWNLYPLLVHLNLFGNSYYPEVKAAILKYL